MPSRLKKAIGAVKDQTSISLAKVYSSNLQVAVLKATTHDDAPIDERYVNEILQLVSSNKIYASVCARAIGRRITRTRNWIVALKSLMLVLRIFQDGDPYFPREVVHATKRGTKILNLSNFKDESDSNTWDYTAFVRMFALYLDERLDCFLTGKLQRRYMYSERGDFHRFRKRTNDSFCDMKPSMLLDRIQYWQRLLERAIATRPTGAARGNRLVQISLYAVLRESFDLYKDVSDGLALLLDSFSDLQYESCVRALQICVESAKQFEELDAFYSLCQTIGVGRPDEYPTVELISEDLIETLQGFLKEKSSSSSHTPTPREPLRLLGSGQGSRSQESYGGQSRFSGFTTSTERYSDKTSELGSGCTSLEELINATKKGEIPSISIDLEAYSDQFEMRSSETGSTRSLPMTDSMVDLISFDDWPENEEQKEHQEQERTQDLFESTLVKELLQPTSSKDLLQSNSGKGWELVLAESVTPSSNMDWEFVHQTDISSNTIDGSTAIPLFNQPQPINHYNPFLQGIPNDPFSTNITFQTTNPSYWAQTQSVATYDPFTTQALNDPFATDLMSGDMYNGMVNQQNLIQQQQLWLQNQNKIMARYMTNV